MRSLRFRLHTLYCGSSVPWATCWPPRPLLETILSQMFAILVAHPWSVTSSHSHGTIFQDGWHKALVLGCLPLAAPVGLSPLLILTLCGPERVLVVSTGCQRGGGEVRTRTGPPDPFPIDNTDQREPQVITATMHTSDLASHQKTLHSKSKCKVRDGCAFCRSEAGHSSLFVCVPVLGAYGSPQQKPPPQGTLGQ